jgi:hypothetical protein
MEADPTAPTACLPPGRPMLTVDLLDWRYNPPTPFGVTDMCFFLSDAILLVLCSLSLCINIYIYREREREILLSSPLPSSPRLSSLSLSLCFLPQNPYIGETGPLLQHLRDTTDGGAEPELVDVRPLFVETYQHRRRSRMTFCDHFCFAAYLDGAKVLPSFMSAKCKVCVPVG